MSPILASLPPEYEVVVYDNARRAEDWKVFGRYVAIHETRRPVIVFQDDDCLVDHDLLLANYDPGVVTGVGWGVERMARYHDTTLLGWGAIFDRELPFLAFDEYARHYPFDWKTATGLGAEIIFPMLSRTRTVMVDEIVWLDEDGLVFERDNRMWKQPGFYDELDFWLARTREVRDL